MRKSRQLPENHKRILFILILIFIFSLGIEKPVLVANATESDKVLITQTKDDLIIIPDKYNTGCSGELTELTPVTNSEGTITSWRTGDILLFPSGSGENVIRIINLQYKNKDIIGDVIINNIDFSDKKFRIYDNGLEERHVRFVFNNCKFSSMTTGKADTTVTYEFNNCTFQRFDGSNATFDHCKFGGSYSDGMVPFRNVEVNNCYFSDMTHPASGGEVHTDGTQIYGDKNNDVYNIHFSNCRFEIPALSIPESNAYVNACIMLQLEFSSGSEISFRDCIVNGGSNTIFAWSTKGDWRLENVTFDGIRFGNAYLNGLLDSRISPAVDFNNLSMSNDLYIGSVWKDTKGTHLSVTNDSARDKELIIYTDKGCYRETIEAFHKPEGKVWNIPFNEMPFDEEILIEDDLAYVVCYSQDFPGCAKQIRFVNFNDGNDVYIDKSVLEELTCAKSDLLLSGTCGKNITFTLTNDGLLTLSGTGATYNYHSQAFPEWYVKDKHDYRDCIKEIIVEEGIEGIGNALFAKCNSVEKVTLPSSLTSINQYAFDGCVCLDSVTLPANLKTLGTSVFRGMQLKQIYYEGDNWENITISKGNDVLNNNVKYENDGVITYRIVYALNDDDTNPAKHLNPLTFSAGDKLTFTAPQREGYIFEGWFSDSKFIKEITGLDGTETDNVRLYAKWTEKTPETDNTPDNNDNPDSNTDNNQDNNNPDSNTDNSNDQSNDNSGNNDNSQNNNAPENDTSNPVCAVEFTKSIVILKPGKKINNIKYAPGNTNISYTSSNINVATVDNQGIVKAVNAGTSTITAMCDNLKTSFTVYVSPKKTTGVKLKKHNSSGLKISWKRDKNATGYQIIIKTGRNGTYKQMKQIKKNRTVTYTKKNLRKGNVYFIKIRAYKSINGQKIYGSYSKTKKITLK